MPEDQASPSLKALDIVTSPVWRRINLGEIFAKKYVPLAMKTLVEIMEDPDPPPSWDIRRKAANDILARAEGKPRVLISVKDDTNNDSVQVVQEEIKQIDNLVNILLDEFKASASAPLPEDSILLKKIEDNNAG